MKKKKPKQKIITEILRFFGVERRRSFDEAADIVNPAADTGEFEYCVMCGKLTDVPVSMPVDLRENYESGIGQICNQCAKIVQIDDCEGDNLSNERILMAVEQCRNENKKR